jgi:hypothetical protein
MRPETVMMISDAIDAAGAMVVTVFAVLSIVTVCLTLLALFVTIGLMRLWRRLTVGTWSAAITSVERKAFE